MAHLCNGQTVELPEFWHIYIYLLYSQLLDMSYSAILLVLYYTAISSYLSSRENKMATEKYGCFVKAKTSHYSVFTSLKRIKTK